MKTLIIDDEKSVRETTKMFLELYGKDIEILDECGSVAEGYEAICRHQPELVLLDVEMPDGTGFDLLSKFEKPDFAVIFITGHNDFAIRAFKFSAIDYLLKPLDPEDLVNALDRARQLKDHEIDRFNLMNLISSDGTDKLPERIILSDSDNLYMVETRDIIRCKSEGNYTHFYLQDGSDILISRTLKEYDEMFKGSHFFRTHQSHLINLKYFSRYSKKEGGYIVMKDDSEVPLAVRKKEQLFNLIKGLG